MQNLPTTTKKIILSYSDPDATDSSSDDELFNTTHKIPKKKTHEFIIKIHKNSPKLIKNSKNRGIFVGAHKRSKGKYSSEITDPFTKKRVWLGTFMNAEEASRAYRSKKREFAEKLAQKGVSVEKEGFGFFNGVQVVDEYGFFLGEFSKLDDLSICAASCKVRFVLHKQLQDELLIVAHLNF